MCRQRSLEAATPGVLLGGFKGRVRVRQGLGFRVEQQPQRLFLFIDITRLLGQVPEPGRGVQQAERAAGEALHPKPRPSSKLQAVTAPPSQVKPPRPKPLSAQGHR